MAINPEALRARFADFELDTSSGELIRNGCVTRLQGQPFLVLQVLLDHPGEVVTREQLRRLLWQNETFVDFDQGLNKAVFKLRDALGDSNTASALIQTIPRRGYRFTAEVHWIGHNGQPITSAAQHPALPVPHWLLAGLAALVLLVGVAWTTRRTIFGCFNSGTT